MAVTNRASARPAPTARKAEGLSKGAAGYGADCHVASQAHLSRSWARSENAGFKIRNVT